MEFCYPPRLENLAKGVIDEVKAKINAYREFWARKGDKIIRVLIIPMRNKKGKLFGVMEIVEDLTYIVNNAEEAKKRVIVL